MSNHTEGTWTVFINDSGDANTGFPISIHSQVSDDPLEDSIAIVRMGGFYPYEWDERIPKAEHVANAHLMSASPELLKGLEWALSYVGKWDDPMHQFCKDAINKAKGVC